MAHGVCIFKHSFLKWIVGEKSLNKTRSQAVARIADRTASQHL